MVDKIAATDNSSYIINNTPEAYRLIKKKNGELVLQGMFEFLDYHYASGGIIWKDIPTEIEE